VINAHHELILIR